MICSTPAPLNYRRPSTFSAACPGCRRTLLGLLAALSAALRFVFATLKGWNRNRRAVYLFAPVLLLTFNTEAQGQTALDQGFPESGLLFVSIGRYYAALNK